MRRRASLALWAPLALCVALGGCATSGDGSGRYDWVALVGKAPSKSRYELVGTVTGSAPDVDFVAAAEAARDDIRARAAKMGAQVVRIDEVRLPPPRRARKGKPSVLLVGRAYKQLDD